MVEHFPSCFHDFPFLLILSGHKIDAWRVQSLIIIIDIDKKSLQDGSTLQKKGVVCQEEKIARYGVLFQDILGRPGQRDFEVGLG